MERMNHHESKTPIEIEIKFDPSADLTKELSKLGDALKAAGFETLSVTKSKFKPIVELVVTSARRDANSTLATTLHSISDRDATGIEDWHIRG